MKDLQSKMSQKQKTATKITKKIIYLFKPQLHLLKLREYFKFSHHNRRSSICIFRKNLQFPQYYRMAAFHAFRFP